MTETAAPAPASATVRMFGKCGAKRCRSKAVVEVPAERDPRRGNDLGPTDEGWKMLHAAEAAAACVLGGTPRSEIIDGCVFWHGLQWSGIRGRVDRSIACGSKCTEARGADCRCECGGEFHGQNAS